LRLLPPAVFVLLLFFPPMPAVLIVDDLLSIHEMLDAVIQPTGFATAFTTDGQKALARYKAEKFDLVLADIDMKPMDGITLLKQLKLYDPNCVVIIMTAYASTESAIQALKFGAFDYLPKPFKVDELIATLKRGMEFRQFNAERAAQAALPAVKASDVELRLIGPSAKARKLIQQIKKLCTVRTPVLLVGETGTGKGTVADVLHAHGDASQTPMVRIDCALTSEPGLREGLLGQNGAGGTWVERAKGSTLLLEHIQCLPLPVQKEFVSVLRHAGQGIRLICTSNVDLEKLTDEGNFNDELFYRVASLPVVLPPLRERIEDLPALVKHFTSRSTNPLFDANLVEFTEDAMAVMRAYHWPGNLAELEQVVSKIVSTTEARVVTSQQLPMRLRELKDWPSLDDYLAGQQKQYVDMVLRACQGNKARAAEVLGVDAGKLT
jgi:two-component system response regulator HydG